MKKEMIYIEPAHLFSHGYDPNHLAVLIHFDGFRQGADAVEEFMIDFPMSEDFYDAMKYYCNKYEEYMIKKFAEK
jgi:hypothetical protein